MALRQLVRRVRHTPRGSPVAGYGYDPPLDSGFTRCCAVHHTGWHAVAHEREPSSLYPNSVGLVVYAHRPAPTSTQLLHPTPPQYLDLHLLPLRQLHARLIASRAQPAAAEAERPSTTLGSSLDASSQLNSEAASAPRRREKEYKEELERVKAELERVKTESAEVQKEFAIAQRRAKMAHAAPGFLSETARTLRMGGESAASGMAYLSEGLASLLRMSAADWRVFLSQSWQSIKHEAEHYWAGTKLLGTEISIASRLLYKALQGKTLTRRERKQLVRTTNDLLRVVPFAMFVIIPFMELLLPVALKLFPNMLPSTFQDKLKQEEEQRKRVQVKMEVAKFLQDCVAEKAKKLKKRKGDQGKEKEQQRAKDLYALVEQVRMGRDVSNEEFAQFASLFSDELTLDNLGRTQLVGMSQFLQLSTFGTDNVLRYKLRQRLREIKADDRLLQSEGLTHLTYDELAAACQARGLRWAGETKFGMKRQVEDWLDLSLDRNLPPSLLILSRAMAYTTSQRFDERLVLEDMKSTLSSLPGVVGGVTTETMADEKSTREGTLSKLDYLRTQDELIQEEEKACTAIERTLSAAEEEGKALPAAPSDGSALLDRDVAREEMQAATAADTEAAAAAQAEEEGEQEHHTAEELAAAAELKEARETKDLAAALSLLCNKSVVADMREELNELMQGELKYYKDRIKKVRHRLDDSDDQFAQDDALRSKVEYMMKSLDKEMDKVDAKVGSRLHLLDQNQDGRLSVEELLSASELLANPGLQNRVQTVLTELTDRDGAVNVADLEAIIDAYEERERKEQEEVEEAGHSPSDNDEEEHKLEAAAPEKETHASPKAKPL